jgi:hypothetical protein
VSLAVIETDGEGHLSACIVLNGPEPEYATVDPLREIELQRLMDPPATAGWAYTLRKLAEGANWITWRRSIVDWDGSAQSLLEALQGHLRGEPLGNLDEVLLAIEPRQA